MANERQVMLSRSTVQQLQRISKYRHDGQVDIAQIIGELAADAEDEIAEEQAEAEAIQERQAALREEILPEDDADPSTGTESAQDATQDAVEERQNEIRERILRD